jgi:acyl transferase domain-containing protein
MTSTFGVLPVNPTELWKYYGITPNVVIGQSVGEVAAAYASGALTLENAVKVIYHRSEILSRATGGSMFVVILSTEYQLLTLRL